MNTLPSKNARHTAPVRASRSPQTRIRPGPATREPVNALPPAPCTHGFSRLAPAILTRDPRNGRPVALQTGWALAYTVNMGDKWEVDRRRAAVERWLIVHGDALYRYAFLQLRHRESAEDAVQETLLGALRSTHPPDGRASEKTWLFAILKHKLADHARACRRSPLDQCIEPGNQNDADMNIEDIVFCDNGRWREQASWGDPVSHGEAQAFWRHLNACLWTLPGNQAEVFVLREVEGLSLQDICQITGVSTTNAYVLLHRARLALRRCLTNAGFGPDSDS